ncbi:MAG TPA: methionyl-tRNA formyltransferase [Euzebya sp.]|nr:methionyl-tRNA formyltransferase [Euzebya sp.]
MRIAFFGTPAPAVPSLEALLAAVNVEVAAVITNPDRPSGRGHRVTAPPVKDIALRAAVPVWQPAKPREVLAQLAALRVDACAVVAYGSILPADLLAAGGKGFVNLHFSLLPAWRGAAPVPASILAGDRETGVTCFRLDPGMDTGDILVTHATRILPDETAGELTQRLAETGAGVMVDALRGLVDGSLPLTPQDHAAATYAPKISPQDAAITWADPAERIDRMVRAYNPMPGAYTTVDGKRLKLHRVTPTSLEGRPCEVRPGIVLAGEDGRPIAMCGQGAVRLDEVQPAGRPRMDGAAFARGHELTALGT